MVENDNLIEINLMLDEEGFVTAWGTNLSDSDAYQEKTVSLEEDDPFFSGNPFAYKVNEKEELIFIEDKNLYIAKKSYLEELNIKCTEDILKGFEYSLDDKTYWVSFSEYKQKKFEEFYQLFNTNSVENVLWEFLDNDKKEINILLDKVEFLTLNAYANIAKQYKMDKLKITISEMIEQASSLEELYSIKWEFISDNLPTEKPVIQINDLSNYVSKDTYNNLLQENKELYQRVDSNEQALLDAINMLSSMIIPE